MGAQCWLAPTLSCCQQGFCISCRGKGVLALSELSGAAQRLEQARMGDGEGERGGKGGRGTLLAPRHVA